MIYRVTEKVSKKKKGTPNKQRDNTDNFHLLKTELLSEANNLLLHLQRNDISFAFCLTRVVAGGEKGR